MKRRFLSLALTLALLLSLVPPSRASSGKTTFADVPTSHWAYSYIQQAFEDGAINGTSYNEKTGVRMFSPNDTITAAQMYAIIARAFYPEETAASTATGAWYAPYVSVVEKKGHFQGWGLTRKNPHGFKTWEDGYYDEPLLGTPVRGRYPEPESTGGVVRGDIAVQLCILLYNKGVKTFSQLEDDDKRDITRALGFPEYRLTTGASENLVDYWTIPEDARLAVSDVYQLGIMGGYPDGSFGADKTISRAEFAAIYVRIKDAIRNSEIEAANKPAIPYGEVGTMSNFDVTLSMDTHYVRDHVPNYWAEQTDLVKSVFNTEYLKDALNAYIHTSLNAQKIVSEGRPQAGGHLQDPVNDFYNYAVFEKMDHSQIGPGGATRMAFILTSRIAYPLAIKDAVKDRLSVYTPYLYEAAMKDTVNAETKALFDSIIARFTPNMTDREKIKVLLDAMDERWDYKAGTTGQWNNDEKYADCDYLAVATNILFAYAGFPSMSWDCKEANHVANFCFLPDEGVWVIVDATGYLARKDVSYTVESYMGLWGLTVNPWDTDPESRPLADITAYINRLNPTLYGTPASYFSNLAK